MSFHGELRSEPDAIGPFVSSIARASSGSRPRATVPRECAASWRLFAIRRRQSAAAEIEMSSRPTRTLPPRNRAHGHERKLVTSGAENREIIVSEKPVGRRAHMEEVLRFGADPAEDAEDGLDEERRLDGVRGRRNAPDCKGARRHSTRTRSAFRDRRGVRACRAIWAKVFDRMKSVVPAR